MVSKEVTVHYTHLTRLRIVSTRYIKLGDVPATNVSGAWQSESPFLHTFPTGGYHADYIQSGAHDAESRS